MTAPLPLRDVPEWRIEASDRPNIFDLIGPRGFKGLEKVAKRLGPRSNARNGASYGAVP